MFPVTAYRIGYGDVLLISNQFGQQTYDTRTIAALILDYGFMNRTTACFLRGETDTFENVYRVSIVHLQEDRFI